MSLSPSGPERELQHNSTVVTILYGEKADTVSEISLFQVSALMGEKSILRDICLANGFFKAVA